MITGTIERIRAHLRSPGVTKKALAEKARLHPNTLQGIEEPRWNPTAATLIALEAHIPDEPPAPEEPDCSQVAA